MLFLLILKLSLFGKNLIVIMKAGFGKEQINIKEKLELTGFNRGRVNNKTLDGIFCKAILIVDKKILKFFFEYRLIIYRKKAYQQK